MNNKNIVKLPVSIRDCITLMSNHEWESCICVDNNDQVKGIFTEGDFRKIITMSEVSLDHSIEDYLNKDFIYVKNDFTVTEVRSIFKNNIIQELPVIDNGVLVDVLYRKKYSDNEEVPQVDYKVVIMAGGKGTRLDPFTKILPKPLIPYGDDPVIKVIMDRFHKYGMREFYISLNDKSKMIKSYFYEHVEEYDINYIYEGKPLGTVGSLKLLENQLKEPFFLSNCDIILNTNYSEISEFHKNGGFAMTIVAASHAEKLAYGVCQIDSNSILKNIVEKPVNDYLVNTGLYLLNSEVLEYIPSQTYFDMPDLIDAIISKGFKVGVYPVSENSWVDVGQWSEYYKAVRDL